MSLKCSSCGYDNDPTRVYCHNCGEKLQAGEEASALPGGFTPVQELAARPPARKRRPIAWGALFSGLLKVVILAGLTAAVVLAVLPPLDLPPPVQADERVAERINDMLKGASASSGAISFGLPGEEVQKWFVSSVHFKSPEGFVSLRPERVYAVLGNSNVRVGLQAALPVAVSIYFEGDYEPVREGNSYVLRPKRYSVGRLPLPVILGWPVERQLCGMEEALAPSLERLARASYIGVTPERVTLRFAGRGR